MIALIRGIENYPGYSISNIGSVSNSKEKILKARKVAKGYLGITLCKNGICNQFLIHRLMAKTFIPNPDNKPEVNHINGDKLDNRVENLEWCTRKENVVHSVNTGLKKGMFYGNTKRDVEQYSKNGILLNTYGSIMEAALSNDISSSCISKALNGKQKTCKNFIWKFKTI